jgi:hypothetical protein
MGINGTPKKRGRKPAINEDVTQRLEHALKLGASEKSACAYAGVGYSTFYAYKAKDQEFRERLHRARRSGEIEHLEFIAAEKDWRARAWLLAVMDPPRYAIKHRLVKTEVSSRRRNRPRPSTPLPQRRTSRSASRPFRRPSSTAWGRTAMAELLTLAQLREVATCLDLAEEIDLCYAREDPNLFTQWVLKDQQGARVRQAPLHRLIQDFWDWCVEQGRHGLILAPWGHGKSEQTAIARPLYALGRDPNLRIKLVCNSDENARARVLSLRRYLEQDPDLARVFPDLRLGREEKSTSKLTVHRDGLGKDPSVEAFGIMSSSLGSRSDLLVCDDIVDLKNAIQQPAMRPKVAQAFREGFLSRLEPEGICLYIATVWHMDDLTMQMRKTAEQGHGFAALVVAVSDDVSRLDVQVHNAPGFGAPETLPLWDYWPQDRLIWRRDEEAIGTRAFARGYQQRPMSDEDAHFREEWFRSGGISRFVLEDLEPAAYDCYLGVDPAISSKKQANEFALAVIGHHRRDKKLRLLERLRTTGLSVQGQADAIIHAVERWSPVMTRIEDNAYQAALGQVLEERGRQKGLYIPMTGAPSTRDKAYYLALWSPLVENGSFEIDADRFGDVVDEAISFPVGSHPDILDAISRAVQASSKKPAVAAPVEETQETSARWGFGVNRGRR